MNTRHPFRMIAIAAAAASVFSIGVCASPYLQHESMAESAAVSPTNTMQNPIPAAAAPNFRAIVSRFGPAVVGVNVEGRVKVSDTDTFAGDPRRGPRDDDPFSQFFGDAPGMQRPRPMRGQGSGFIVSADGVILTNAHVVKDADRVTVKLSDRREFKAKVLGIDPVTDVAVLKIDAHDLATVQLGNSDQLAVGDYVLAIGQPYGFEESATSGIVSAKGRTLPGDSYVPFIQTDVAVNPGNSGGPLFDGAGNVVGINSQIYSNTGGYEGLSFAIPIKVALQVKDEIVAGGKVEHAQLGVTVQPLTQSLAESFHLDKPDGALVSNVTPQSAAAHAGIQAGDVILAYNDHPVIDAGDLSAQVGMARAGDQARLRIWRERKSLSLDVTLRPAQQIASAADAAHAAPQGKLGLAVRPLTPDECKDAGVSAGLVVEQVSGPAESAGIQPGDVVLSANGTALKDAQQLRDIVARQEHQVALLIVRGDARIFVPVPLA